LILPSWLPAQVHDPLVEVEGDVHLAGLERRAAGGGHSGGVLLVPLRQQLDLQPCSQIVVGFEFSSSSPMPGFFTSSSAMMRARSGEEQNR